MRLGWREAAGIVLSAALLWWALHDVQWPEVWAHLQRSNLPLLLLSAVVATSIFPLRARRWRTILDPVEPGVPLGKLWRATAVGMMVNNVIPARVGELVRVYALTREAPRVTFSAGFASLAVDRLFDAVVLFGLMLLSMFSPAFPRGARIGNQQVTHWVGGATLGILALLAMLYLIVVFPARVITLYEAFARRVAPRYEERGKSILLAFASGLGVLRRPARFASVLAWTVLHWLVNAAAFWIGFRAVGIDAPYSAALFVQGLIAFGVALPSAPGFWGIFEGAAKVGLAVYHVDPTRAVTWAIGYHLLSFIPITVIGAFYFTRLGIHLKDVRRKADDDGSADESDAPPTAEAARA
ncbi:MAG TPA: lysylphosphatidylglycerol synthase transmembrane domain-containing protein [Gemmatimonadaceae bacterium]|nr:lysylphosphatidylglycerol synthase transmembrane domain-containing protein [Gemmatimonadaceae bacterium]